MSNEEKRDLVLNPGEYAYLQDLTRGQVKVHVGPCVVNQTGQEQPVRFDPDGHGNGQFTKCFNLEQAVTRAPVAGEGDYVVLYNPSTDDKHPDVAAVSNTPDLMSGCKYNIPGPCTFALWPSQHAQVIKGHTLRSNQYLVVEVYNEDEARKNWNAAIFRTTEGEELSSSTGFGRSILGPCTVLISPVFRFITYRPSQRLNDHQMGHTCGPSDHTKGS